MCNPFTQLCLCCLTRFLISSAWFQFSFVFLFFLCCWLEYHLFIHVLLLGLCSADSVICLEKYNFSVFPSRFFSSVDSTLKNVCKQQLCWDIQCPVWLQLCHTHTLPHLQQSLTEVLVFFSSGSLMLLECKGFISTPHMIYCRVYGCTEIGA